MIEKLERFKEWLKEEATSGGALHQEPVLTKIPPHRYDELNRFDYKRKLLSKYVREENVVLLAPRRDDVPKEAASKTVMNDMLASLGIRDDIVDIDPQRSHNQDVLRYAYEMRDRLGGNMYYPDDCGRTSVAFRRSWTEKLTEEHVQN